jgi:G3E family GTPase
LLDFRSAIARMVGLDHNSLTVADYEIIARIERIISSINSGVVVQTVANLSPQQEMTIQQQQQHQHHHHQHRSVSPRRDINHSHHNHHSHHSHHNHNSNEFMHSSEGISSTSSSSRCRSRSPKKVIIDPNSY